MPFFRTLYLSLTSASFYDAVLRAPVGRAWDYFAKLHLLVALLYATPVFVFLIVANPQKLVDALTKAYPEDLIVTVKAGELSINQELPYAIPMPEVMRDKENEKENDHTPKNAVVFVHEADIGSFTSFLAFESFVVATEKAIYVLDERGQMRAFALPKNEKEMTVSRTLIDEWSSNFLSHWFVRYHAYALPIAFIVFLTLFIGIFLGHALLLVIFSALVWILARLFLKPRIYGYGALYQIGLHSFTLIIVAGIVLEFLGLTFFRMPVQLLAFLAWTMWILSELGATPAPVIESSATPKKPAAHRSSVAKKRPRSQKR